MFLESLLYLFLLNMNKKYCSLSCHRKPKCDQEKKQLWDKLLPRIAYERGERTWIFDNPSNCQSFCAGSLLFWIPAYMKHTFTSCVSQFELLFFNQSLLFQPKYLWAGEYPNFTEILSINLHRNSVRLTLSSSPFTRAGNWELNCSRSFPQVTEHLCFGAVMCTQELTFLSIMLESSCQFISWKKSKKDNKVGNVQSVHVEVSRKLF